MKRGLLKLFILALTGVVVITAVGCGRSRARPEKPDKNAAFAANQRAAKTAFESGGYRQAADMYRSALRKALITGDTALIADIRYNLAVSLLQLYEYDTALGLIVQARQELEQDGMKVPPDLPMLEAVLLYRIGRIEDARDAALRIVRLRPPPSLVVRMKTIFLLGLIAGDQKDPGQLSQSIASLRQAPPGMFTADIYELQGRLSFMKKEWRQAAAHFENAARIRRENAGLYRMQIALALAAEAYGREGRTDLSALRYLQAGRGAALAGDRNNARIWLTKSAHLFDHTGDDVHAAEARFYLSRPLEEPAPPNPAPPDPTLPEKDFYLPDTHIR